MRAISTMLAAMMICSFGMASAHADPATEAVQRALKDQGFYYGEITGRKDADTTAAIRRYQIRNGLQITGELNAETQKSLGLKGAAPVPRATPSTPTATVQSAPPPPDTSVLHDDGPLTEEEPPTRGNSFHPVPEQPAYVPDLRGLSPETSGLFDGTPFEVSPPAVQQRVIIGAQSLLARRGYYRGEIDGVYGPGTEFAVRAYQARFGMQQTGRLNMETLGALGLLPGQQAPGITAPLRREYQPRSSVFAPNGERIYIPR